MPIWTSIPCLSATGAMRHLYLTKRENVAKRVMIHAAGFNLGLLMRVRYGMRKPRSAGAGVFALILALWMLLFDRWERLTARRRVRDEMSDFRTGYSCRLAA